MYRPNPLIPICLLMTILIIGFFVWWLSSEPTQAPRSATSSGTITLRVTMAPSLERGERVIVTVTATNDSSSRFSYTYPTTCSAPTLRIDDQVLTNQHLCGQALTPVSIAPGIIREMRLNLMITTETASAPPDDPELVIITLAPGTHRLAASWAGVTSPPVNFTVAP